MSDLENATKLSEEKLRELQIRQAKALGLSHKEFLEKLSGGTLEEFLEKLNNDTLEEFTEKIIVA